MYKSHFERAVNPTNLAMFINSYIHRTDLHIARTPSGTPQQSSKTLKMPVINITGSLSPHADDTVTFNGRLDPTNSSWMKVSITNGKRPENCLFNEYKQDMCLHCKLIELIFLFFVYFCFYLDFGLCNGSRRTTS